MSTYYLNSATTDVSAVSGIGSITDGDSLIVATGSQTVNAGLTTLDASSKNLNLFRVTSGFTGTIGSGSGGIILNCSNGTNPTVLFEASGTLYIAPRTTGPGTITRIAHNGTGTVYVVSGSGTVTTYEQSAGTANIDAGALCTNLVQEGGEVAVGYNATALTTAYCTGGTAGIQRAITTLTVGGDATVTVFRSQLGGTLPTSTTVYVYGGTLNWLGGDITSLYLYGGVFDDSQAPLGYAITNLYTTPAARAASSLVNATITNKSFRAEYRTFP